MSNVSSLLPLSRRRWLLAAAGGLTASLACAQSDPVLTSWSDGAARARILAFVRAVTEPGGKDFVPVEDRIAVFDNDGTLWSEQPMYFQLAFALDRVRALAPKHPEWKTKQPFKAAIEGDMKTLAAAGEHGVLELVAASHAGLDTDEFAAVVKDWFATARHPKFKRPIAAFGNSDGDFQMLEWTTSAPGAGLGVIVHHDDAEREFAYDRKSHVGKLDRALDEASSRGWTVVSIRQDWKQVFRAR